jgi:hypothetical protein
VDGGNSRQVKLVIMVEHQSYIFQHTHGICQAVLIAYDEIFQALAVEGDALPSKQLLGCTYPSISSPVEMCDKKSYHLQLHDIGGWSIR